MIETRYTMEELLVEYVKYHELAPIGENLQICGYELHCDDCKVKDKCRLMIDNITMPKFTKKCINILKKDYPEYLI